jgi:LysM repeat protein
MAVSPPVPLALEKQRRLCLVDAYVGCATYGAAMAARAESPARATGHSRPIARMTPVVLDHGRIDIRVPALRSDRASQGVLVGLLGVAFLAILLSRPADPAGAGPLVLDRSPAPNGSAASSDAPGAEPTDAPSTPTEAPTVTDDPTATVAPSAPAVSTDPGPEVSPGSAASPQPTLSGETYRVKSGDTLTAIAGRFGTTPQELARLNDIADPSSLKIGQILILP